jgi:hypothetical protein
MQRLYVGLWIHLAISANKKYRQVHEGRTTKTAKWFVSDSSVQVAYAGVPESPLSPLSPLEEMDLTQMSSILL